MHVLYCGVHDAPGSPGGLARLQALCAAAVEAFAAAGLLLPQDQRPVKLHATLMNTRYRQKGGNSGSSEQQQQGQQRWEERRPFDGRALLERHGGLDLGAVALRALHISERGAFDAATGFYRCFDSLPLS